MNIKRTPDMMYGALRANVDISGFTATKALDDFNYLLDDDLWMKVGPGFTDINEFLKTINLSDFKLAIGQRKEVSQKLADLQASQRATAKALGVDKKTISNDLKSGELSPQEDIIDVDNEEVMEDSGELSPPEETPPTIEESKDPKDQHISPSELLDKQKKEKEKEAKKEEKKEERDEKRKLIEIEIEKGLPAPNGVYDVIAIDPPWEYSERGGFTHKDYDADANRGGVDYPTMTVAELGEMDIPSSDNCVMYLWTTHAFLRDSFDLLEKWGFNYKATIVWDKVKMGMGRNVRMQCEFCLLAVKGKPEVNGSAERDIITEARREHSRKPEEFYSKVERMTVGYRLDYFAREQRKGWFTFGAEINKF